MHSNYKGNLSTDLYNDLLHNYTTVKYPGTHCSYGKIYRTTVKKECIDTINPFLELTSGENFGKPIHSFIIKICLLEETDGQFDDFYEAEYGGNLYVNSNHPFYRISFVFSSSTFIDSFIEEINAQCDIYSKTMRFGNPICPAVVGSYIITQTNEEPLLDIFEIPKTPPELRTTPLKYGILVMTEAKGLTFNSAFQYNRLDQTTKHKIQHEHSKITNQLSIMRLCAGMHALIRLAIETGYYHGDHHFSNLMIDVKNNVTLIDFGHSEKIPPKEMAEIKELYNDHKYLHILRVLCRKTQFNRYISYVQYSDLYGWACGDYNGKKPDYAFDDKFNDVIDGLVKMQEQTIDSDIQTMNALHETNPARYPLFPLSNTIKSNLYMGHL
jgi:hypothetical protein